jgi:hypothetical protein
MDHKNVCIYIKMGPKFKKIVYLEGI